MSSLPDLSGNSQASRSAKGEPDTDRLLQAGLGRGGASESKLPCIQVVTESGQAQAEPEPEVRLGVRFDCARFRGGLRDQA